MATLLPQPAPPRIDPLGTLFDLAQLSSMGQQFKDRRQATDERTRATESQAAIETALGQSQNQIGGAIAILERQGKWPEARLLRDKQPEIAAAGFKEQAERYKAASERLKLGGQLLQPLDGLEDPNALTSRWQETRPQLVEMFGDQPFWPAPDAQADAIRSFVPVAIERGLTTSELASRRASVMDRTAKRLSTHKASADLDKVLSADLGEYAATVDDETEWGQMVAGLKDAGASDRLLTRIGAWSPEAPARVAGLFGGKTTGGGEDAFERELARRERERGGPMDAAARSALRRQLSTDQHAPETAQDTKALSSSVAAVVQSPRTFLQMTPTRRDAIIPLLVERGFDFSSIGELTGQQKNQIEQWYQGQMSALNRARNDFNSNYSETNPNGTQLYNAERGRLTESYKLQMGGTAETPAPGRPATPKGDVLRRKVLPPTGPTAPPARPTPSAAASTPAAPPALQASVEAILSNEGPGEFDLQDADGSVMTWRKLPDGTVQRVE